jgi:hypothetical protein
MLGRGLFGALVFSLLLAAGARVVRGQVSDDALRGPAGALVIEKSEDQAVEPMTRGSQLRVSKQLYRRSPDCVAAKLDLWIHDGRIEYIVFAPHQPWKNISFTDPAHLTFGDSKCQIHVRISADDDAKPVPFE